MSSSVRCTELTGKKGVAFLSVVAPASSAAREEDVHSGRVRLPSAPITSQPGEAKCLHILPARRKETAGAVLVASKLSFDPLSVQNAR